MDQHRVSIKAAQSEATFCEFRNVVIILSILGALIITGCAGTVPKAEFKQQIPPSSCVAVSDEIKVGVKAESEVTILELEKMRIAQRIEQKIAEKKALNARDGDKKNFEVEVTLTRYDKGNAFARAMLAGLGQIHIDGNISLYEMPERKKVGEFIITKTFAWGGIYGASTSMEDIEVTFADGVAMALTGTSEESTEKK